jgi:glycosyltransferase involved in cell wall biosynthesis
MTGPVRAGIVSSHPIQYFSPLYDLIHAQGIVDLTVVYGNDAGVRPTWDPGFAGNHQWDLDLVGGHPHMFLTQGAVPSRSDRLRARVHLRHVIRSWDVAVINGYSTALTTTAIGACWMGSVPYLLRSDTSIRAKHPIASPRHWWPRAVSRRSAGGLAVGRRNAAIHRELGTPSIFSAPFAVDVERFRTAASRVHAARSGFRRALALPEDVPVIAFAGKFLDLKRPSDVLAAAARIAAPAHVLMIGDGPLSSALRSAATDLPVTFTGFLNQEAMPEALACADVLVLPSYYEPWGLIVNEAMACGCVPVVSDQVGCGPDLVAGLGEIFPVGDLDALGAAIGRALVTARSPGTADRLADRLRGFTLEACAAGYEEAMLTVSKTSRR